MYGAVFFVAAAKLEDILPETQEADRTAVILSLRGVEQIGSTFIKVLERYAIKLCTCNSKLVLTGVHPHVRQQVVITETTEVIAQDDIFLQKST